MQWKDTISKLNSIEFISSLMLDQKSMRGDKEHLRIQSNENLKNIIEFFFSTTFKYSLRDKYVDSKDFHLLL